jgi:hypothetical protein
VASINEAATPSVNVIVIGNKIDGFLMREPLRSLRRVWSLSSETIYNILQAHFCSFMITDSIQPVKVQQYKSAFPVDAKTTSICTYDNHEQINMAFQQKNEDERNNFIEELMHNNDVLISRNSQQKDYIRILKSLFGNQGQRPGFNRQWELTDNVIDHSECVGDPLMVMSAHVKQLLYMFYNGHDLDNLYNIADLPPSEIF